MLAAVLSALLYANALDNPFVYDDFRTVLNNPSIENVWAVRTIVYREMTRPVVNFSYAFDRAIGLRRTARSGSFCCAAEDKRSQL